MMILVMGGSGCGKSAYAEKRIVELAAGGEPQTVYYLATMQVYGEEGRRKVERHIALRKNKGMLTIEQIRDVAACIPKLGEGASAILLEDLGNLVANEMFLDDGTMKPWEAVAEKVTAEVLRLKDNAANLVVVSNNVFEDGTLYEEGTDQYIKALGGIHCELAKLADEVIEVVVGIPCYIKGEQT
ncbi:MAG: bifunctional adenosylcobinamide kinase/adenosylcobinamide-phosphate guanylyltransferase [Lachnospiraceae bacterium]|nr:bifunctional adenosylcobinamide kinase/adenosylcobinamide-phosphate guanylyltransferase [Lachnospiraceae bacterium]